MPEGDAALYEEPGERAGRPDAPAESARSLYRGYCWRHVEARQGMWRALDGLTRYIATARVAKNAQSDRSSASPTFATGC